MDQTICFQPGHVIKIYHVILRHVTWCNSKTRDYTICNSTAYCYVMVCRESCQDKIISVRIELLNFQLWSLKVEVWPDGDRRSTVARWSRRRAAPAYGPMPDLTWPTIRFSTWFPSSSRDRPVCVGVTWSVFYVNCNLSVRTCSSPPNYTKINRNELSAVSFLEQPLVR